MNKSPLMGKIATLAAICLFCSFCALAQSVHQWGWAEARPLPADYDGDGADDLAIYDPSSGCWYVFSPAQNSILAWGFQWGMADAEPTSGDYDGDGADDLAVYHPTTAKWFIYSLAREVILAWGQEWGCEGAAATPGDYDGDGRTDLAVYHRATGRWHILPNTPPEINDAETLWNMYLNALLYAAQPRSQADVYTRLTAVTPNNASLQWREHPHTGALQVKAAAVLPLQTATNLYSPGFTTILPTDVELRVTMVPELREFMARYRGLNKALRAKQILGLPPDDASDTVVEFWVAPAFLLRPSPDPEITDTTSEIDFSYADSRYLSVSPLYLAWFQAEMAKSYDFSGDPRPWTRMGYTYDWARTEGSVAGLSEFVIPADFLYITEGVRVPLDVETITQIEQYGAGR